jgi:glucose-6-phosphate-specific signal transduction histidine kinase
MRIASNSKGHEHPLRARVFRRAAAHRRRSGDRIVPYRQESLSNVVKYADATTVHLSLRLSQDFVELSVLDDGKGNDY